MSRLEITVKADELISAITRLAEALEANLNRPLTATTDALLEEKPITIEQVRALLAAKSQAGKQAAVKELISKYGATKLTDVDPSRFADMLQEAEAL